jgi:hypothetical protein
MSGSSKLFFPSGIPANYYYKLSLIFFIILYALSCICIRLHEKVLRQEET